MWHPRPGWHLANTHLQGLRFLDEEILKSTEVRDRSVIMASALAAALLLKRLKVLTEKAQGLAGLAGG